MGLEPQLESCCICGKPAAVNGEKDTLLFSVPEGGIICPDCAGHEPSGEQAQLIYPVNTGIVDILKYFMETPMKNMVKLGLDDGLFSRIQTIVKAYMEHHLGIGKLKSEDFIGDS